jgi:hypothetical protein
MAITSLIRLEHYPMILLAAFVISPAFLLAPCPKTKGRGCFCENQCKQCKGSVTFDRLPNRTAPSFPPGTLQCAYRSKLCELWQM